jgi:hypothetical protein
MRNFVGAAKVFVVLFVLVAAVSIFNANVDIAKAQGGDYTTTWTATDLIVARLKNPVYQNNQATCLNPLLGNYGSPIDSEVALGVAKWTVKGQISGSTKYKELWSVPEMPTAFTYGGTWQNNNCVGFLPKLAGNNNQTDWLWGFMHNSTLSTSAMELRTVGTATAINSLSNVDAGRVANTGKTTSCQLSNRCVFTSGPYSWTTFHELDEAGNGKHLNAGTLIPLKWTVTGYLCEAGDNRCD